MKEVLSNHIYTWKLCKCLEALREVNSCYSNSASFPGLSHNSSSTLGSWPLFQAAGTNHKHQANSYVAMNVTSAIVTTEARTGY